MITYSVKFYGSSDAINTATRIVDHIFRQCYNVYGGKRVDSKNTYCHMTYTAQWLDSGLCRYSWQDVFSLAEEKLLKLGYDIVKYKGNVQVWEC